MEIVKIILKFLWNCKVTRIATTALGGKNLNYLQNLLSGCSNQENVVYWHKDRYSDTWNRIEGLKKNSWICDQFLPKVLRQFSR